MNEVQTIERPNAGQNPAWAELVQLVPIVSLAFPFIVSGSADLERAGRASVVAALLTIPVCGLVLARGHLLNPILAGTGLWLWVLAAAFQVPFPALAEWLGRTQGFSLFVLVFVVGVASTLVSPYGFIGCRSSDARWIRRASLGLLGLTGVVVMWAWWFRHDLRLGGGLPFIVVNVARRVACRAHTA